MTTLRSFLEEKLAEAPPLTMDDDDNCFIRYSEDENPAAIAPGDPWLHTEPRTGYIWRIGALSQVDSNKCDFVRTFIAYEREPGRFQFIGMLKFDQGENDDLGFFCRRLGEALAQQHPAFDR